MEITFNPRHYAHVPLIFWPYVWLQLFLLRQWSAAEDRQIVFEIDARGKVHVLLLSDDKADLRAWLAAQKTIYRDHWTPMHDASGEAHLCAYHYWMGRLMECGRRVHFKSNRGGIYPAPSIEDSS
jgi:nicotinamide mononucleotide adenylyltransferase